MTLIDFGDFKIRFDPKEVRINIDGEIVDVGRIFSSDEKISARRDVTNNEVLQKLENHKFYSIDGNSISGQHLKELVGSSKKWTDEDVYGWEAIKKKSDLKSP